MDRDKIAENWLQSRQKSEETQPTTLAEEPSPEEMRQVVTRYYREHSFNTALFDSLLDQGVRTEDILNSADIVPGVNHNTHSAMSAIGLGSTTAMDGTVIEMRAILMERQRWGEHVLVAGTERQIWFEAKEKISTDDNFQVVPDGTFKLSHFPIEHEDGLIYGPSVKDFHSAQIDMPGLLEFNQQLKDIAEIIGIEIPTQEDLDEVAA